MDGRDRPERLVPLGRIGAPHGLRGEVRFFPYAGLESETLRRGLEVRLEMVLHGKASLRKLVVQGVRRGKKALLVKFESVDDRTAAGRLTGATLHVRREDLPPLEEGEFYYVDVVGVEVRFEGGDVLGVVRNVFRAAQDVLEIETPEGMLMVPVLEHLVTEVGSEGVVLKREALEFAVRE